MSSIWCLHVFLAFAAAFGEEAIKAKTEAIVSELELHASAPKLDAAAKVGEGVSTPAAEDVVAASNGGAVRPEQEAIGSPDSAAELAAAEYRIAELKAISGAKVQAASGDGEKDGPRRSEEEHKDMTAEEQAKDSAELEVHHYVPQQEVTDNAASLRIIPFVAALLSFAGVFSYSFLFLCKILRRKKKSQGTLGQGSTAKSAPCDDLEFEDLEYALDMVSTPLSRKSVQSHESTSSFESTQVDSVNGWSNDMESDAGWGDDAWGNDCWDADGLESDDDLAEAAMAVPRQATAPGAIRKGKAD